MPEKLMTLEELSKYLGMEEGDVLSLVDKKVISAYKIGGELLRFRREQIDAIRSEITAYLKENNKVSPEVVIKKRHREKLDRFFGFGEETFQDKVADFFYFNDFYIYSGILIIVLLAIIFHG